MRDVPPGWAEARVGELIELGPRTHCPDETVVGFVPLQRLGVSFRSRHTFEPRRWSDVKRGYTHFADGDVLLARITPSFENGKAGVARGLPSGLGAGSTEYFVCRPHDGAVAPEYLLAHFKTRSFLKGGEHVMSGAVGQQRVPKKYLLESTLPLAPIREQRRIVKKLDALFARVDACREHVDRIPDIVKRFRQAVLVAATSGELTQEWRQSRGKSLDAWTRVSIGEVASVIDPNPSHRYPSYANGSVPILSTEQFVGRESYDLTSAKLVNSAFHLERLAAHGFADHDIVFARKGRLGLARWLPKEGRYVFSHTIFLIRAKQAELAPYLLWSLRDDRCVAWLLREMHSNQGVPTLGKAFMERYSVPLPPADEQVEVVRVVRALFDWSDGVERCASAAGSRVDLIAPAAVAMAFRGELVAQDPTDEPASLLLARIREGRSSSSGRMKPPETQRAVRGKELAAMMRSLVDVLAEAGEWITAQEAFRGCGIVDGSRTELIEAVYAELRELERSKRVVVEAVRDGRGLKLYDRLKRTEKA